MNMQVWMVVDISERLDLRQKIVDRTIHSFTCPRCLQSHVLDATLLVFQPSETPRLIFCPVEKIPFSANRLALERLLFVLRESLSNAWRDEWVGQLKTIPLDQFSEMLKGLEAQIAPPAIDRRIPPAVSDDVFKLAELSLQAMTDPDVWTQVIVLIENILSRIPPSGYDSFRGVMLNDLGTAYTKQPGGNSLQNIHNAIAPLEESLRCTSPETERLLLASTLYNLGNVYTDLPVDDGGKAIRKGINYYIQALRYRSPDDGLLDYATLQNNLGVAYARLPGCETEPKWQAVACFLEALRYRTPENAPQEYAATKNNLGNVYKDLPSEDRRENIRQAMACYTTMRRFDSFPQKLLH